MSIIKTVIYPEQCKEYYEALKNNDYYAVNIWYNPPIYKSLEQINQEMNFLYLQLGFNAEIEYIKNTPNTLLETELKDKYKYKDK